MICSPLATNSWRLLNGLAIRYSRCMALNIVFFVLWDKRDDKISLVLHDPKWCSTARFLESGVSLAVNKKEQGNHIFIREEMFTWQDKVMFVTRASTSTPSSLSKRAGQKPFSPHLTSPNNLFTNLV